MDAPEGKKLLAAVFRPPGPGPSPVVVVLHGTQGFRVRYVQLAENLAKGGLVTVAGCWFGRNYAVDPATRKETPTTYSDGIECPSGPELETGPAGAVSYFRSVSALVGAARTLPGVRADRVGLLGHSRGSMAALITGGRGVDLRAIVAVAGYTPVSTLAQLLAPVLILQGTADIIVPVQEAREFERALRAQGKPVEAYYYEGAPHQIPLEPPWSTDVRQRAIAFFAKHLLN